MKKSLMQMYLDSQIKESRPEPKSAPQWLKDRMETVRNLSPPTPEEVDAQWKAAAKAKEQLDRCVIRPGEPIPPDYLDILKSWKAFREHPAWKNHPQLI